MIRLALLLAVLVAPVVGAVDIEGFQTIAVSEYIVAEHQVSLQDPGTGTVNSELIDVGKRHNYEVHNTTLGFRASITASFVSNSNGVWNLTFLVNDTIASGCQLLINTVNPGVLANDILVYPYYETFCFIDELPGNNINSTTLTKQINTTLQAQSGSPAALETLNIDLAFLRTDEYMVPQDTNEALGFVETLGGAIALIVLLLFAMAQRNSVTETVLNAIAVVVGIAAVVALPDAYNGIRVLLAALTLYAAVRVAFQGWNLYQDEGVE